MEYKLPQSFIDMAEATLQLEKCTRKMCKKENQIVKSLYEKVDKKGSVETKVKSIKKIKESKEKQNLHICEYNNCKDLALKSIEKIVAHFKTSKDLKDKKIYQEGMKLLKKGKKTTSSDYVKFVLSIQ